MARIVHLANFVGPRSGGLRTMLVNLAAGYRPAGHDMHLVIPEFPGGWDHHVDAHVHSLPSVALPRSGGYRIVRSRHHVHDLLDSLQPQIIELSDRLTLVSGARWGKAAGVPVTFFAHERIDGVITHHVAPLPARLIADRMNRALAAVTDSVVTTTRFAAREFTRIGVPTQHIPLGVDALSFVPRTQTDSDPSDLRLVMCSRLSREKSPETAISLLREARAQGRSWSLMIIGDGPLRGTLDRQARGLPVTFAGFVRDREHLASLLRNADACVAPGPIETFGLAALEALACGTPVVCHAASAIPEVIRDAGVSVDGDARQWVRAVEQVTGPRAAEFRRAARSRALELPWSGVVGQLLAHHRLTNSREPSDVGRDSQPLSLPPLTTAA